jgi:hypothetical protein
MTTWVAGMRMTAARLNNYTPIVLSGTPTPATHWTVSSFQAIWVAGNTTVEVEMLYGSTTITAASNGQISPAVEVCTLPYVPPWQMWSGYQVANATAGSLLVNPDGTTYLQVLYPSQSITSGTTIYFTITLPTG